jgi:hypothetical protein
MLSFVFIGVTLFTIKSGKVPSYGGMVLRDRNPIVFWLFTGCYIWFAVLMALCAVWEILGLPAPITLLGV